MARDVKRKYGGIGAGRRVSERRAKLLAAGLQAFGTKGFAGSSVKEICGLAGLTERYFYESFANKEDLLRCVYHGLVEDLVQSAEQILKSGGSREDPAMALVRLFFETLRDDPRIARVLYFEVLGVSPAIDAAYREGTRKMIQVVKETVATAFPGMDEQFLERSIITTGLAGAVNLILMRWVLEGFSPPLETMLDEAALLLEKVRRAGFLTRIIHDGFRD